MDAAIRSENLRETLKRMNTYARQPTLGPQSSKVAALGRTVTRTATRTLSYKQGSVQPGSISGSQVGSLLGLCSRSEAGLPYCWAAFLSTSCKQPQPKQWLAGPVLSCKGCPPVTSNSETLQ